MKFQQDKQKPKENTMKTTNINTTHETEINASYETSKFALTVGISMAAVIGLWGLACMVGGLVDGGLVGLLKGFITAITGN
jgi:hypothetical protein